VARLRVPDGVALDPALLAYVVALVIVACGLTWRARRPASLVADLVVELGESRSGTLRDRLARALGDPTLAIGWWSSEAGAYVDDSGAELPVTGSAISVDRDGAPFALVVHDAAALGDPALVEAVASATRLSTSNVALRASVRSQADELIASRRRLLLAGDSERRRLEARLREGPERRLQEVDAALAALEPAGDHVERARLQLLRTLTDLAELGSGLHPREPVDQGLDVALRSLAERAGLPVEVRSSTTPLPDELAATAYFVCAEALANVSKYADASHAVIEVETRDGRLRISVEDDGRGGADPARGSGLHGLADRVEALGGTLRVESPPGRGTRLAAELPLDGESQ
jgi:signal transduction histidine kinase